METLLTPYFLQFNPILTMLLANSVSLASLNMSFLPTCRRTTSDISFRRIGII